MLQKIKHILYTLLKKSERYTKTDMIYLAKGGGWLTGGQIFFSGLAFLSSVAFANLIPKETFGIYRYFISIAGIVSIFSLPGIASAVTISISRGFEGILFKALKYRIISGYLTSFILLFGAIYYFHNANSTFAFVILLLAIFLPIRNSFTLYDSIFLGKSNFSLYTKNKTLTQGIITAFTIVPLFFTKNIIILISVYLIPPAILYMLMFFYISEKYPLNKKVENGTIQYGIHLSFLKGVAGLATNLHNIIVFHFLGPQAVALYYFITAPSDQLLAITSNIQNLLVPKIAKNNWRLPSLYVLIRKMFPFLGVIFFLISIYALVAPFFFSFLFPKYGNIANLSSIYSFTTILVTINIALSSIMLGKQMMDKQYVSQTVLAFFDIMATSLCVFNWGLKGLIASVFCVQLISILFTSYLIFLYRKKTGIRGENTFV